MGTFALGSLGVKSFPRRSSLLGALAFSALYVIARTGSLGVQSFFESPFAPKSRGVERPFTSLSVLVSLGVKSCLLYVKRISLTRLRQINGSGLVVYSWESLGLS